jgi:HlyD family secretion protein
MRIQKHVRTLAGVTIVGALAAAALWPEAVEVDMATVTRNSLQVTVDEDGVTRVRDRFLVTAPVAGRLQRIELEPGDRVSQGTVVVRLAPIDAPLLDARSRAELETAAVAAQQAVGQARAEHDRVIALRDRAAAAERRLANLVTAGAVSREDYESAQTALETSRRSVEAAGFAVQRAEREWQLARTRLQTPANRGRLIDVLSPASGAVLKRLRESESVVIAGEPLIEIGDPAQLEVVADFLSTDAVRVRAGAPVLIERWGGDQPLHGRVRRVEPSGFLKVSALGVEEQRVNVIVDFDDDTAACDLGDAYRVEVRIIAWEQDDLLTVPVGSLFRRGDQWAVFVADHGVARLTTIQIGERSYAQAHVVSGLAEGERVVLHPPDTLADGDRLRARGE